MICDSDPVGDSSCRAQGESRGDPSLDRLGCEPLKEPSGGRFFDLEDKYSEGLAKPSGVLFPLMDPHA